jgi:hypothetical protein
MKKQKNIDEIINEMTKKYHFKSDEKLVANWFYQNGDAFWTDVKIAIKVSGYENIDGLSDRLCINNPSVRQKTDDDRSCPAYNKIFPTDISDYREIKIQEIDEDLPIKDKYLQFGDGWIVYSSEEGKNPMYIKTDNDNEIKAKIHCWYYRLILELEKKCHYNGSLYYLSESKPLYYTVEYADKKIEIVFAPCSMFNFHYPKWDKDKQEIKDEEEMQEEVESERQTNEEPAESLNDRHEEEQEEEKEEEKDTQEQEELPDDADLYDIVFNYLIKHSCIPTSNGSGGLNIDCPYQKKDICKQIGAIWSPRYYRWYIKADRLKKAAEKIACL